MDHKDRSTGREKWIGLAITISLIAVAGYYSYRAGVPGCGPLDDGSGASDLFTVMPIAIPLAEALLLLGLGLKLKWPPKRIVSWIILALVVTLVGEVLVAFHFFVSHNCGE
jgi:hypothetical protein